jgi:hypothetical protein
MKNPLVGFLILVVIAVVLWLLLNPMHPDNASPNHPAPTPSNGKFNL